MPLGYLQGGCKPQNARILTFSDLEHMERRFKISNPQARARESTAVLHPRCAAAVGWLRCRTRDIGPPRCAAAIEWLRGRTRDVRGRGGGQGLGRWRALAHLQRLVLRVSGLRLPELEGV